MRYFIHLSFNGTNYHGWQIQKRTRCTGLCSGSTQRILGNATAVTGCGRTDAGVHARDFRAHFNYSDNPLIATS